MKITKEQIKAFDPCQDGYDWYLSNGTADLLETLLKVNEDHPDWAIWLYTKLMTPNQNRRIAIFAAEQVLHVFENEYPNDKRPRLAIEAAKAVLLNDTEENRELAYYASYDAYMLAYGADSYRNNNTYDYAHYAPINAANAASFAIYQYSPKHTIWAATRAISEAEYVKANHSLPYSVRYPAVGEMHTSAGKKLQELIIKEAVRILEEV